LTAPLAIVVVVAVIDKDRYVFELPWILPARRSTWAAKTMHRYSGPFTPRRPFEIFNVTSTPKPANGRGSFQAQGLF
jgi:hypothetical protein